MKLAFPSQTGSSPAQLTCSYNGTTESRDSEQMFIRLSILENGKSHDRAFIWGGFGAASGQKAEGQERFCQTWNLRGKAITH